MPTAMPEPIIQIVKFVPDYSAMPDGNNQPITQKMPMGGGSAIGAFGGTYAGTYAAGFSNVSQRTFSAVKAQTEAHVEAKVAAQTKINTYTQATTAQTVAVGMGGSVELPKKPDSGTYGKGYGAPYTAKKTGNITRVIDGFNDDLPVALKAPKGMSTKAGVGAAAYGLEFPIAQKVGELTKATGVAANNMNAVAAGTKLMSKAMHVPFLGMFVRGLSQLGPVGGAAVGAGVLAYYAHSQYAKQQELAGQTPYLAGLNEQMNRVKINNASAFTTLEGNRKKEDEIEKEKSSTSIAGHYWSSMKDYGLLAAKATPLYWAGRLGMAGTDAYINEGRKPSDTPFELFDPRARDLDNLKKDRPELFARTSQMVDAGSISGGTIMLQNTKADDQRDEIIRLLDLMAKDRRGK